MATSLAPTAILTCPTIQSQPFENCGSEIPSFGWVFPRPACAYLCLITNNVLRCLQVGERAGTGQDVLGACSGANGALEELVALTEDFKEEVGTNPLSFHQKILVGFKQPCSYNAQVLGVIAVG